MAKFNVGDTVQLMSGGEVMTINQVYEENASGMLAMAYKQMKIAHPDATVFYGCTWFKGKDLQNSTFREEVLKKAE